MHLVVGLGNPGREHEKTRHNMGYMALDQLSRRVGITPLSKGFQGFFGMGMVNGEKVMLAKPTTFMNLSGQCVGEIVRYYNLLPEQVLILYDDIDLPLGRLRLRASGSAGTHNGMRSVLAHMGTQAFPRLRVGVGKPEAPGDLIRHVLETPSKAQWALLEPALEEAARVAELWIRGEWDEAMRAANTFGAGEGANEI